MNISERRVVPRFAIQVPLRFRPSGLIHDREDHAAESINISRCGVYFASPVHLQVAKTVEVQAIAVINKDLEKALIKQGFQKATVLVDGEKVEAYVKTIQLK